MSDTCLIGPMAQFDAIAYARSMIEDSDSTSFIVPDASMLQLVKRAAGEFSPHLPLDDVVGNPATATSPCMTSAGDQSRTHRARHGFPAPPSKVSSNPYPASAPYSSRY